MMDTSEKNELKPDVADEWIEHSSKSSKTDAPFLKYDKHGLPLSPQPSDDPDDPLNWPLWIKIFVLLQVSFLGGLGTLNVAVINPAYNLFAEEFGITVIQASYQTTTVIAVNGIAPFIFIPLANVYGRRPIYVFTTLLGFVSSLACAFTKNYTQLLCVRVVNGLFPVAFALGVASVCDMFCMHQRGRAMGVYTAITTNGGHFAPIPGGLIGEFLGWRWIFKFTAILDAAFFIFILFCLPETLYVRTTDGEKSSAQVHRSTRRSYLHHLRMRCRYPGKQVRLQDFVWPSIRMMKYPSVLLPALYYGTHYGLGSILPAVTVTHIFSTHFGWDTLQIGLAYGGSLTIGCFLGETAGGWVVDRLMYRARKRSGGIDPNGEPPSECRLQAIWTGEILVPVGLLMYGFGIQYNAPWIVPILGMGVAMFGVQCITTVCYTYSSECYREQAPATSQLFNFIRQEIGMTFAFYAIPLAEVMRGYQWLFILFAGIGSILAFIPILFLMKKGAEIRAHMQ